jgi:integrase/recombinase XerD
MKQTDFARILTRYLADFLPGQRNVSSNTIKSYRIHLNNFSFIFRRSIELNLNTLHLEMSPLIKLKDF